MLLLLLVVCTAVAGCFFSFQARLFLLRRSNPFIDLVCGSEKVSSCTDIILSRYSWITKDIHFTDLAVMYFSGQFLFLLFSLIDGQTDQALVILLLPCSMVLLVCTCLLLYQRIVLKGFCKLCILIISMACLQEAIIVYKCYTRGQLFLDKSLNFFADASYVKSMTRFLLSFGLACSWLWFKTWLRRSAEVGALRKQVQQWKQNFLLFSFLFKQQRKIDDTCWPEDIVLGNPDGKVQLLLILSPYCKSCVYAYATIVQLLKMHANNLRVIIRFNQDAKSRGKSADAARYLLALLTNPSGKNKMQVLSDWYASAKNTELPTMTVADENTTELMCKQYLWMRENRIQHTPALFLNAHTFPHPYEFKDLFYLLPLFIQKEELLIV